MGKLRDFGNKLKDSLGKLRREKKPEVIPEETIFAPKLSDECFSLLSSLFDELGPRPAASDASRNAARRIASQFEKFTDDVTVTTGKIIPDITKWHLVSLAVFSSVVFLFSFIGLPYIALPIAILFIIAISRDLAKKSNPLRRFFPSAVATNVHAVIEPEEEVYRTIIFSAHHDTASISGIDDAKMKAVFSMNTALLGFLALSIVSLLSFIEEIFEGRLFRANIPDALIVILLFISFLASLAAVYIISMSGKEYTGGAGDNLSGVAIVTTLGLYFSREKKVGRGMKNTRLVFVSFDGEECEAQGSNIWYSDNSHLLVNAENINFDGIFSEDDLVFLSSDGNGLVSLSQKLAAELSAIASSMGYKIGLGRLGLFGGETDAVSAAIRGIAATTLTGMPPGVDTPSHSTDDTPDKVSPEALSRCLQLAIRFAMKRDERDSVERKTELLLDGNRKYKLSRQ